MSNNVASNVIAMREFDNRELDRPVPTQQAAQFEHLLEECRNLTVERLEKSLAAMLDHADDALWQLATQSQDRDLRDLYVNAKDKVRSERRRIEADFRTHYLAEFQNRARRDKKPAEKFSQYDLSSLELGLVNDDDLEETLKVNDMGTKLRRYCEEELAALDQRIGVLVGDANLQGDGNPFSPQAICTAFKLTCRGLEDNLKVRMALLKLFDDHVLDDIRSIYKDLNTMLVDRSILPKIRYGKPGRTGAGLIGPRSGAAALAAGLAASGEGSTAALQGALTAEAIAAGEQDMFAMLQNMMAVQLGVGGIHHGLASAPPPGGAQVPPNVTHVPGFPPILGGPAAPMAAGAVRALQGAELLGSLTRIQHGDISVVGGGNLPLAATLVAPGTTNVLRELKSTSLGSGLGQIDSMTLDIVALLFDQIFGDERIPPLMKGLIGRLQIPMLKVAILDKTFFSKKSHPARRLLDSLGEIALGLNADFDENAPFYKHVDNVVQKLVDGFQDSMDIFDPLREEIERFVAEEARRADEEAKLVAKRIEYKEKLELAKAVAQQEILQRAKSGTIPRAVLKFLADQWVKLMLVAHAKHGNESDAWKTAVETMDLLIWSVKAKQSMGERRKLAAVLPGLLKRLNTGLQMVGTDDDTRKRFFAKLMRCHTKVMNAGTAPVAPVRGEPAPATAPPVLTEVVVVDDSVAEPAAAPALPSSIALPTLSVSNRLTQGPDEIAAAPAPVDEDTEPTATPPEFSAVTIQNPFGEGEVEIEEISLADLPPGGAPLEDDPSDRSSPASGDEYGRVAGGLSEGMWVEFRDDDDNRRQARLSFISPLRGTYLFVNRQGKKVGEYSLYQLAREFRTGRASILEAVPLFDRAMGSLVGALRTTAPAH